MVQSAHQAQQKWRFPLTSILTKGDTLISKLETALDEGELIEIWEANLAEPADDGENKFKGSYYQWDN